MLLSWVEKPPSDTADMAWQMASNQLMPAQCSAKKHATVMER